MMTTQRHPLVASMIFSLALLLTGADTPVKFDRYDNYSEKTADDRKDAISCMAISTRKEFDDRFDDHYFGFGESSKAPRSLPKDAFETRMVIAVVRRGNALWTYEVDGLRADGDKLTLRYKTTRKDQPSATFACPMIVSLPKGSYRSVIFIENDKEVGKATIGDAKKPWKHQP
jgi:hypothetical protein